MTRIGKNHWLLSKPIAHRGIFDNKTIPENSFSAFRECISRNVPIELDIRLSKDGVPMVFHDSNLGRMTQSQANISELDKAQLSSLQLLNTAEHIPTFEAVLNFVNGQVPLLIELKNEGKADVVEKRTLELLKNYQGGFAIQSFNPYSLLWLKKSHNHVLRGQLSGDFRDVVGSPIKKFILKYMLFNWLTKPDFISYDIRALPSRRVAGIRKKGSPILSWTIRTIEERLKAQKHADNVISELREDFNN